MKTKLETCKRICCILLSVILVLGSLRVCPMQQVKASAGAISAEASTEVLMLLWNMLINTMIAGGAGEMKANYDQEKLTFETFMNILAQDVMGLGVVHLADGTTVPLADVVTGVEDGSLDIPDLGDWGAYRDRTVDDYDDPEDYLVEHWSEILAKRGYGGDPSSGEDPEEPEPSKEPEFSKIKKIVLGSGIFTALSGAISKLWNGEIEGVDLSQLADIEEMYYTGELERDTDGKYVIKGNAGFSATKSFGYTLAGQHIYSIDTTYDFPVVAYLISSSSQLSLMFLYLRADGIVQDFYYYFPHTIYVDGSYYGSSTTRACGINIPQNENISDSVWNFNIPVFASKEAAENFLLTGDDTGCLNKMALDRTSLASNLPLIFASIAGKQLAASSLQDLYARLKNAYQTKVKPQIDTSTDTETNTETYTQVMTETVTETETDTDTETGTGTEPTPAPTPTPEPEPETTPEEAPEDIADYKTDSLRMVFPFCIPFDFIDLLKVLDAEPEAPCFEIPFVVPMLDIDERFQMDLSCFDDVMEIVRKLETVSFIILLMFITHKSIKW